MKLARITKLEFITIATGGGFKEIKYKDQLNRLL